MVYNKKVACIGSKVYSSGLSCRAKDGGRQVRFNAALVLYSLLPLIDPQQVAEDSTV